MSEARYLSLTPDDAYAMLDELNRVVEGNAGYVLNLSPRGNDWWVRVTMVDPISGSNPLVFETIKDFVDWASAYVAETLGNRERNQFA